VVFNYVDGVDTFNLLGVALAFTFADITVTDTIDTLHGAGAKVDYGTGVFFVAGYSQAVADASDFDFF